MNGMVTAVTALIAFAVTAALGIWLVPFLKKLKYGQTINDIGPTWHKSKQGTPTMGGIMFAIGIVLAVAVGALMLKDTEAVPFENVKLIAGMIMALAYGFIGFVDDYIKVVKKQNLGLTVMQKTVMQILVAVLYLLTLYLSGDRSTMLTIPFIGSWDMGILYYPFAIIVIYYMVNAVNLTDGIDGLCASVTFVSGLCSLIICTVLGYNKLGVMSVALAAGCLGFLIWNFHPAKVFMGDTGSLFLGGCVVAIGFGVNLPAFLALTGIIFLLDALSVVIQVSYYKMTKKRIFKMSPIHHHFEMSGWSEVKIVMSFSLVGLVGGALAVWAVTML